MITETEEKLFIKIDELEKNLKETKLEVKSYEAKEHMLISRLGGTDVDGNPTSPINFLQRVDILVQKEKELADLKALYYQWADFKISDRFYSEQMSKVLESPLPEKSDKETDSE